MGGGGGGVILDRGNAENGEKTSQSRASLEKANPRTT